MNGVNPDNERIKRRYFHHMREAKGLSEKTVDHACRAIAAFERHNDWRDFGRFRSKDAIVFKQSLMAGGGKRSAELSSRATIYGKVNHLETFFTWLAEQPGFKTKVSIGDAQYFRLSRRDSRIAQERPPKPSPTLEQIHTVIARMPAHTDVELRNRALIAFLILTGARVNAVRTFKLKHLRRDRLGIVQDARDVRTKGAKTFPTFYFPIGDNIREIFLTYTDHLQGNLGRGPNDPLFPATKQGRRIGTMGEVVGLERGHWKTTDPIRSICKRAFESAEIVYFSPHTFRSTLALLAEERCRTPAELKAWSQNLGHDQLLTTLTSYGALPETAQANLIANLTERSDEPIAPDLRQLLSRLINQIQHEHGDGDRAVGALL